MLLCLSILPCTIESFKYVLNIEYFNQCKLTDLIINIIWIKSTTPLDYKVEYLSILITLVRGISGTKRLVKCPPFRLNWP